MKSMQFLSIRPFFCLALVLRRRLLPTKAVCYLGSVSESWKRTARM